MKSLLLFLVIAVSSPISAESLSCALKHFDPRNEEASIIQERSVDLASKDVDVLMDLGEFRLRYRILGETQLIELSEEHVPEEVLTSKVQEGLSFYGMQLDIDNNRYIQCQLHADNMKGFVGDSLKSGIGLYSLQVYSKRLAQSELLSEACRYAGLLEAFLHERNYHWYDMLYYFEKSFREKADFEEVTSDPWLEVSFLRFSQECSKAAGDLSVLTDSGQKLVKVFDRVQAQLLAEKLER